MKRQDRYERTTMYAPIWIANQIGEKGKENNFSFKEKKNFSFKREKKITADLWTIMNIWRFWEYVLHYFKMMVSSLQLRQEP